MLVECTWLSNLRLGPAERRAVHWEWPQRQVSAKLDFNCMTAAASGSPRRMTENITADYNELLTGQVHVDGSVETLREQFKKSRPFRHLVIDDLFAPDELEPLLSEVAAMAPDEWLRVQQEKRESFLRMRSAVRLGAAGARFAGILHSPGFLYLLSEITGIWRLLPDPYLQGGGHAVMRRDDFFSVHSDRNLAYDTGLTRRLALIVFLNKNWQPQYRGELELWNPEATRCEVSIRPVFNRTVIFEVAEPNYHGVPAPLACPPDRVRQSFIVYYHTVGIDLGQTLKPHSTVFAKPSPLRTFVREALPPFVLKRMRGLLTRK